ncbi:unnamed protein product [Euphydryas editha]|uniref:Uncharacterized protein n=1 Tax=Euphydryas editha TaxID=104508 RepID=A0AAU9V0X8_EUPED|nr:unnamed protein product [Euphydryas editha]
MHPRSKHWHLIDYAIVRQRDVSQVLITRVMRGANCWMDHRLVVTKLRLQLRVPHRKCRKRPACLNIDQLYDHDTREMFMEELNSAILLNTTNGEIAPKWQALSSCILHTATNVLGYKKRQKDDWFDQNDKLLTEALQRHRHILRQANHSSKQVRESGSGIRKLTRAERQMVV